MLWKTHKPIYVTQRRIASEQSVLFYPAVLPSVAWFSWLSLSTTLYRASGKHFSAFLLLVDSFCALRLARL